MINRIMRHAAAVQQRAADELQRQKEAEAKREEQATIERKAAFERARKSCPLPLTEEKVSIAGGLDLLNDEFVVSTAREWGLTTQKLTLTTHRLLWSRGILSTHQISLYLTDIRDVVYRKNILGFSSIVIETATGKSIEGLPTTTNGDRMRDQLMSMIHWARQQGRHQTEAAVPSPTATQPDRLDQLRRLGELKAQGILSDEEFQVEKKKLLSQQS